MKQLTLDLREMSQDNILSTGVVSFDKILKGGFRYGTINLFTGPSRNVLNRMKTNFELSLDSKNICVYIIMDNPRYIKQLCIPDNSVVLYLGYNNDEILKDIDLLQLDVYQKNICYVAYCNSNFVDIRKGNGPARGLMMKASTCFHHHETVEDDQTVMDDVHRFVSVKNRWGAFAYTIDFKTEFNGTNYYLKETKPWHGNS